MSSNLPRVGISLNVQGKSPQNVLELAREADEAGIYALGAGDTASDTFAMLNAFAAVTRRIRLISTVATWTRTPLTTARAVRTIDALSDGRYTMGMGSMPAIFNENHHGIPSKSPLQRMTEYVELIRLLWEAASGERVDYEGSFYRVSDFRWSAPPPDHRIPILIGATRPRTIRMAGERADGVIFNSLHTVPWLQTVGVPALREGAQASGRSLEELERGITLHAIVTDEPEQARAIMRHRLIPYMTYPYNLKWMRSAGFEEEAEVAATAMAAGNMSEMAGAVSDRLIEAMTVIGNPEQCRERIAQYASLVDWVVIHSQGGSRTTTGSSASEAAEAVRRLIQTFRVHSG
ncbi:MAG: LLM class flavin-dependent oxidoreductase [Chloroflexi bacterium]|nr:LLM class flavin-dependent oxidoreductase [Chloroflexota bacterium]